MTLDERTAGGREIRERIDRYLGESGLASRNARVVPLTGDAWDRRSFRVLIDDGDSVVLALHTGPVDLAPLPFAIVAHLLHQVPLPVPSILGHSTANGILGLQDLGDVT